MTREQAFKLGAIHGVILAAVCCIAFGVLDVQCRGDEAGPNWSAERQQCEGAGR